ncbi:MAG: DUF5615 family PIN-like protein [Pirellulales bacterium]|nr:DUF5615 family PIN-like protein [Pirellulales bacterium]
MVRGLFRRKGDLDLVRVQDVALGGEDDDAVLEWSEKHGRVLLTHDGRSMPAHVKSRLASGAHVPGVLVVDDLASIGRCIEDILLVTECSEEGEWEEAKLSRHLGISAATRALLPHG